MGGCVGTRAAVPHGYTYAYTKHRRPWLTGVHYGRASRADAPLELEKALLRRAAQALWHAACGARDMR